MQKWIVGTTDKSRFDFRKIADLREAFEVLVLGPEGGLVGEGDGVDQGIGEGELVADEEIGGGQAISSLMGTTMPERMAWVTSSAFSKDRCLSATLRTSVMTMLGMSRVGSLRRIGLK